MTTFWLGLEAPPGSDLSLEDFFLGQMMALARVLTRVDTSVHIMEGQTLSSEVNSLADVLSAGNVAHTVGARWDRLEDRWRLRSRGYNFLKVVNDSHSGGRSTPF
jgi:hypothetical protein